MTRVEFRMLGPLEVLRDGQHVTVGPGRQQALIAFLLIHANEVVAADRLVDELWQQRPPPSASHAVQVYVSNLRRLLEPDRPRGATAQVLISRKPGYLLAVPPDACDANRFASLVADGQEALDQGRPGDATRILGDALRLWRGHALADLPEEPWAVAEATRLQELRIIATERRIDADLALGRHAELVSELNSLVGQHPFRERLWTQLILSLYRSGRQAEALGAYQRVRGLLDSELGLEPAPELQQLEARVLRHDPGLAAAPLGPRLPSRDNVASSVPAHIPTVDPIAASGVPGPLLVGRDRLLARLAVPVDRALAGERATVLVAGHAGIGKTTLVRAAVAEAARHGALVGWGACVDLAGVGGYWPWTQLLNGLVRVLGANRSRELAGDDAGLLAAIAPAFGDPAPVEPSERARLLLMDATVRWLDAVAAEAPVVVVIDDLQRADESSLALFGFVARAQRPAGVCLVGAYRDDELAPPAQLHLGELFGYGEHVQVGGLDPDAVHALVERVAGRAVDRAVSDRITRRTGGHPLFVRELALLLQGPDASAEEIPAAVRDAIGRRTGRLPPATRAVLEVIAVIGTQARPDVVASVLSISPLEVNEAVRSAVDAGVLAVGADGMGFTHDLLRETFLDRIDPPTRMTLHHEIGAALEDRMTRAGDVAPAELARHFTHAVALAGSARATRWALAAAATDRAALAFGEAAGHLRRLRAAVADAGGVLDDDQLLDVLVAEADALARSGSTSDARKLLRTARDVADRSGDAVRVGQVVLATADLGARFAARRDEIVRDLEHALERVSGTDASLEARLTATLARELQHSVAEDRPRAGPLSERALELGRRTGNPTTLAACLLARHDVLWTPGNEVARAQVAREIVAVARHGGDDERHADGLLLLANALLEQGSSAFEATLDSCIALLDRLGTPRHQYTAETRRACVALMRGQLAEAADRIDLAAQLGERIREPDTGNVRMSQRLELIRARGNPDELREFAAEAVAHWTGAPIHANAVAAGFLARAGDRDAARRHVGAVVDLGGWRADRSYLWSVFVRELAYAAVTVSDGDLCALLLDDLKPVAGSCGVNGAVVAFAGSHAHSAGLLAAALDQTDAAKAFLQQAVVTYERLGARQWLAGTRDHLHTIDSGSGGVPGGGDAAR